MQARKTFSLEKTSFPGARARARANARANTRAKAKTRAKTRANASARANTRAGARSNTKAITSKKSKNKCSGKCKSRRKSKKGRKSKITDLCGFQSESYMITVSAVARLMPSPAARVERRNTKTLEAGSLNASIRLCRSCNVCQCAQLQGKTGGTSDFPMSR